MFHHVEEGKDKLVISFAPGHPKVFKQKHLLYSFFLFCKNRDPVSDYITVAFLSRKKVDFICRS